MIDTAALLSSPESVGVWRILPERSRIGFRCSSLWGLAPVNGHFTEFSGDGQITDAQTMFGRLDISAATLDTKIGRRNKHLRSADFFDVAKFPHITVHVAGVDGVHGDTVDLNATLTVRGITAEIPLPVTVTQLGAGVVQLYTQTSINRKDFGVSGNLLGMVVDTATLVGDVVFRQTTRSS